MQLDNSNSMNTIASISQADTSYHNLSSTWKLWVHLPHDTDWSEKSYQPICNFTTVENTLAVTETLPECLIKNCMLFIMRDGIMPMWEDKRNRDGGCFSYKISNKSVCDACRQLTYVLVGNSISTNPAFVNNVTGITISPKKNFCIIKIWLTNCQFQNPAVVTSEVSGIIPNGCLFKKHTPEY